MKTSEIKVGSTYRNKGAGRTMRKVLGIGMDIVPPSGKKPGVFFETCGLHNYTDRIISLKSFAAWAGEEIGVSK